MVGVGGSGQVDGCMVKVTFTFTPDEIGWPPTETESVWARSVDNDVYSIDNVGGRVGW